MRNTFGIVLLLAVAIQSTWVGAQTVRAVRPEMVVPLASRIDNMVFSPDGGTLLIFDSSTGYGLWDGRGRGLKLTVSDPEIRRAPKFSSDGRLIVGVWSDGRTQVREASTGRVRREWTGFGDVTRVASNGDLVAGSDAKSIRIWNTRSERPVQTIAASDASNLYFSHDGKYLASAGSDFNAVNAVRVWSVSTGKLLGSTDRGSKKLKLSTRAGNTLDALGPVLFAPDGKTLFSSGVSPNWKAPGGNWGDAGSPVDYDVKQWETRGGKLKRLFRGWTTRSVPYAPLGVTSDGRRLITGGEREIGIWNLQTGTLLRRVSRAYTSALSTDHSLVAVSSGDDRGYHAEIYSASNGQLLRRFALGKGLVRLALSPDLQTLVVGREEPFRLEWWDWRRGTKTQTVVAPQRAGQISSLLFSLDGTRIGSHHTASQPGIAMQWDTGSGRLIAARKGGGTYSQLRFAPDSQTLEGVERRENTVSNIRDFEITSLNGRFTAVASRNTMFNDEDEFLTVYDAARTKLWTHKTGRGTAVNGMVFSPDGQMLATSQPSVRAGPSANFSLWDVPTGKRSILIPLAGAYPFTFSPDGKHIAVVSGGVRVWDVRGGRLQSTLKAVGYIDKIALSPEGKRLAISDYNGSFALYDAATSKVLLRWIVLLPPPSSPTSAPPTPDWIAVTPEGFYDASPGAARWIRWRVGDKIYPAARYQSTLQRPDIIRKVLAAK